MRLTRIALPAILFVACAIPSMAQQEGKIEAKYDRFGDMTIVQLGFLKVTGGKFDGVQIHAMYKCQGNVKSCKPEKVLVGLLVTLKGAEYDLPGDLIVLADDERLRLGRMSNLGTTELPGWKIYNTSLVSLIPYDTFRKIATAKKVEMRLDIIEFELNDQHRQTLRTFFDQMADDAPK